MNEIVSTLPKRPADVDDSVWQVFLTAYLNICLQATGQDRRLTTLQAEMLQRYLIGTLDGAENLDTAGR